MAPFSIPKRRMVATRAATKATPKPFVHKSRDNSKIKRFSINIIIEERNPQIGSKSPVICDYLEDWIQDSAYDYDGAVGDWAVRAVELTEEQFKAAYESF